MVEERKVYSVDVGDMPNEEVEKRLSESMERRVRPDQDPATYDPFGVKAKLKPAVEFINASKNEFVDISCEAWREYTFDGGAVIRITNPLKLSVSGNGHRLFDGEGVSHYVPKGWLHLKWKAKDGQPHFVA